MRRFYNFTLASGTGGNSYAAMGSITEAELSGYRAKGQGLVSKLLGGKNHQGMHCSSAWLKCSSPTERVICDGQTQAFASLANSIRRCLTLRSL